MPVTLTYPGVYIEELPSAVRTITGVGTSITAFVGRTRRGPADTATMIHGFADFAQRFGGLWENSPLSYAVQQYFLNGGRDALIVRVHNGATRATLALPAGAGTLTLEAADPGEWGRRLTAEVDYQTADPTDTALYNLKVVDTGTGAEEFHRNLSTSTTSPRHVARVLRDESNLVDVQGTAPASRPDATTGPVSASAVSGGDGANVGDTQVISATPKAGIHALDDADLFNLLCIPPYHYDPLSADPQDPSGATWTSALAYCRTRRAMLVVDPPAGWNDKDAPQDSTNGVDGSGFGLARDENAMLYFPRIVALDPLRGNRPATFAPCGAVAGVVARTDANRGVWKAPAGIEATLLGAADFSVRLTDAENGELNPLGINCLRSFDGVGRVVWGARTMRGADRLADQWKYVPVRRLALYIEESLFRGTQWVVFEPNDEPLWAQIRLNVGAFMQNLFRQGAFQGSTPREAYLVKCDAETTTQDDRNRGVVNILVGFAPLKPAEFVVIRIQQLAGQNQA
ncbi:MAG: phage tail sheath family protein [Betaproteobacteria bacterium]|nr:phage tail sheath family protein [Betaproteobacteria bacterium]